MAGASSASSCDVAKLKCSVCNQQFKDPKILHCLHSFCKMCICSLESDGAIVCPLCSRETKVDCIDELKSSFHLVEKLNALEIQEQLMESTQKKLTCDSCLKVRRAAARCLDCSMYLCSSCKMVHHRIPALSQHSMVSLDDLRSGKGLKTPRKEKVHDVCTKHPGEKLKFFCETCQEIVCRDCRVAEHGSQKHATVDIDLRTSAWRSLTQKDAVNLEKAVTLCQSTLDTITKAGSEFANHAEFLMNDVKVYANSIRNMIETEEIRVMEDITRHSKGQKETLKGCTRKVSSAIEEMKHAIETANGVADVPSDQDFSDLQPIINDELSRLLKGDLSNFYNGLPHMTFQKGVQLVLGQIDVGFRVILPPSEFRSEQANPGGFSQASGPASPGGYSRTSDPASPANLITPEEALKQGSELRNVKRRKTKL